MKLSKVAMLIAVISLLSACVSTPKPNPVATKQAGDTDLNCDYLHAEYKGNTVAATEKIKKNKSGDVKDVALGLLIWPGLADFNNAPGHEGNALLDRNVWLKSLAEAKECGITEWPEQPKRY